MRSLMIAAALAMLVLVPGSGEAQTTFQACYVPKSGTVYRIQVEGAPTKCSQNHVAFSWTSAGPEPLGTLTTNTTVYEVPPGATDNRLIPCEPGTLVVSGGYDVSAGGAFTVRRDHPQPGGSGWRLEVTNGSAAPQIVIGFALCVDLTP
jgi:hypothetical protein